MRKIKIQAILVFCSFISAYGALAQSQHNPALDTTYPKGRKASAANFTGNAWVYQLIEADSAFTVPVGHVTFEPGARTFWHSHAGGQALLATGGIGYYQEKGQPIRILRKGDTVKCPPDVEHWHGASPKVGFTQIAVTPNTARGRVKWLHAVSEEEYNGPVK